MKFKLSTGKLAVAIIAAVLIIDQVVKIWVKTTIPLESEIRVLGNWFIIHFTENPGMAFGIELGGETGKLMLSLLRIVLVTFIAIQMVKLNRKPDTPRGIMVGLSLILAGAAGNIFDCMFYGLLFGVSTPMHVASFLPEGGGYTSFLHGKVVDMLYFPIIKNADGQPLFFRPVFNIADAAITIGIFYMMLFQRKFFLSRKQEKHEISE